MDFIKLDIGSKTTFGTVIIQIKIGPLIMEKKVVKQNVYHFSWATCGVNFTANPLHGV